MSEKLKCIDFLGNELLPNWHTFCACCGMSYININNKDAFLPRARDVYNKGICVIGYKVYEEETTDRFTVKHVETKNGTLTVITKS